MVAVFQDVQQVFGLWWTIGHSDTLADKPFESQAEDQLC